MDIFDILGPIMVGPSSSHTAGAARIGKITRMILKSSPVRADIYFHGSFAGTFLGHGSDRAVVGGLLGFEPDDERIRDSLDHAEESGLKFTFNPVELENAHPNTILIEARSAGGGSVRVRGASVGGGNIEIQQIDDIKVSFEGNYDTLIIHHDDQPGAIALVSSILGVQQINIAGMRMFRARRGGLAIMVIEIDGVLPVGVEASIEKLPHIQKVIMIPKL